MFEFNNFYDVSGIFIIGQNLPNNRNSNGLAFCQNFFMR